MRNSGRFLEARPYCPPTPTLGFLPGVRLWPAQEDGTVDPDAVHQEVSSARQPQLHPPEMFLESKGPNTTCTRELGAGLPATYPPRCLDPKAQRAGQG